MKKICCLAKILILAFVTALPVDYVIAGVLFAFDDTQTWTKRSLMLTIIPTIFVLFIVYLFLLRIPCIHDALKQIHLSEVYQRWKLSFISFYNWNRLDTYIVVIALILGFILRIVGYNWGVVASWQADEIKLVSPAIFMARDKVLFSTIVYYPQQFITKFIAIVLFFYSRLYNVPIDPDTMADAYFISRVFCVLLGTATIYTAFLIGNHLKRHLGAIFAVLVSVYPYYVCYAKQVTGDVSVLFFLSLTLVFSLRYMDDGRTRFIILMAMGAAMATLEKWHGGIGIGYIGFILLISNKGLMDFVKKGLLALGSYILWMFLIAPNIVIRPVETITDGFINIAVYDDAGRPAIGSRLVSYFGYGFENIGGSVYLLIFLSGIAILFIFNRSKKYAVLSLGLMKVLILCFMNRGFPRWAFELYFSELLIISLAILFFWNSSSRMLRFLGTVIICILFVELVSASVLTAVVAYKTDNDTRLIQRRECKENGITPDNMISQIYTGFGPASWCDSEYPCTATYIRDWSEYFVIEEDSIFRTSYDYDYVCLNLSRFENDIVLADQLDEYCHIVYEYNAEINDIFDKPFINKNTATWSDFSIIRSNFSMIKSIFGGSLTGIDMVIYYIGNLEVAPNP